MAVAIDDDAIQWSDDLELSGRPLLLLLHGFGGDEHVLDPVAAAVDPAIVTAALRGPRPARGTAAGGYAWWDVDEHYTPAPGQDAETVGAVLAWLDATIAERGAPSGIAVAGFSQGAALALHLLRTEPERWAAIVTLAGTWLPIPAPADDRLAALRPSMFWGRAEQDPAISPAQVDATRAALAPIAPGAEHVYPGATHEVLPAMVADLVAFLRERLLPAS